MYTSDIMKYMRRKNKAAILQSKLFYAILFLLSSLLLFSPIFFKFDLNSLKSLGIAGVFLFNFISSSTLFFPAPGFLATGIGGAGKKRVEEEIKLNKKTPA